jgi:hypothetical protein
MARSLGKYFVVWRLKERYRQMGEPERKWRAYPNEEQAREQMKLLRGLTVYRALSFGLGCLLEERGRP